MNLKIFEGIYEEPMVTAKQFQEMHDIMFAEITRLKEENQKMKELLKDYPEVANEGS